jgi:hypothetical protein
MQNTDMHHAYVKSLLLLIGGVPRAGEIDAWLDKISKTTGIGFASVRAAHYGRWISKNQFVSKKTLQKLEQAAEHARQTSDLVTFLELQIAIWETAPELFQHRIGMARRFIADLRRYDAERLRADQTARDDAGASAPPAGLAAAGADT